MKILVFGVSGMLGHVIYKKLLKNNNLDVFGTVRDKKSIEGFFSQKENLSILDKIDIYQQEKIKNTIGKIKPDLIINCIGIVKQLPEAKNLFKSIYVNSLFPQLLAEIGKNKGFRLIHFSTDCVFSGKKGCYQENDFADADDIYGRSKKLGEVKGPNCLTLRTSIIGHELESSHGLISWFLKQENCIEGYKKVIFSGLPTIEIAEVLENIVIDSSLQGLYHLSAEPISKFDLLTLVSCIYGKKIQIKSNESEKFDRSLNSTRFRRKTEYVPPSWPKLIKKMHNHYLSLDCYNKKI